MDDPNFDSYHKWTQEMFAPNLLESFLTDALNHEFNGFDFDLLFKHFQDKYAGLRETPANLKIILSWYSLRGTTYNTRKLERSMNSAAFLAAAKYFELKVGSTCGRLDFTVNRLAVLFPDAVLYARAALFGGGLLRNAVGYTEDMNIHTILCWPGGIAFCKQEEIDHWYAWYREFQTVIQPVNPTARIGNADPELFIQFAITNPRVGARAAAMRQNALNIQKACEEKKAKVEETRLVKAKKPATPVKVSFA